MFLSLSEIDGSLGGGLGEPKIAKMTQQTVMSNQAVVHVLKDLAKVNSSLTKLRVEVFVHHSKDQQYVWSTYVDIVPQGSYMSVALT